MAFGAAGNVLGALGNRTQVLGDLAIDPQLRAAINVDKLDRLVELRERGTFPRPVGFS